MENTLWLSSFLVDVRSLVSLKNLLMFLYNVVTEGLYYAPEVESHHGISLLLMLQLASL